MAYFTASECPPPRPPSPLQNPLPAKSAFKAFPLPSTNSLFTIGMQRDDKIFFLLLLLFSSCSLFFFPPPPTIIHQRPLGKGSSSVFLRSSGSRRGRRHRREKNPEEKVEGRKCCRFFKILSSASSSTLLHPLVSARGSLCQSFHGQEPVLETRSKPKATRIHIYITRRATDCHNGSRVTALPLLLPATLCHFGRSLDHSSGEGK